MDNVLLFLCFWTNSFNGLKKAGQVIYTCNQDIFYTVILDPIRNSHTFVSSNIHIGDIFVPFHNNSDSDINCTFYNPTFIAYIVMHSVYKNDCVNFFQRSFLLFFHNGKDLISDPADSAIRNFNVIQLTHMAFNIIREHSTYMKMTFSSMSYVIVFWFF